MNFIVFVVYDVYCDMQDFISTVLKETSDSQGLSQNGSSHISNKEWRKVWSLDDPVASYRL